MPGKYVIKPYVENGIFHIFNRGGDKHQIFRSLQDYAVYFRYVDEYLLPKEVSIARINNSGLREEIKMLRINRISQLANFANEIQILAYCFMPNHIHFVLKQSTARAMSSFIKALHVRYVAYFNRKYKLVGPRFQSRFKAKYVATESYILDVSLYVHRNPAMIVPDIARYPWSSLKFYVSGGGPEWLNSDIVSAVYNKSSFSGQYKNYAEFVNVEP
ncbi:hypothetical protein A3I56_00625 [Candidatus Roizmanbacteria bacterium RIFCSPLOWO2_02_FULL_43_10]|uniref:Transposase IS200-like domain-containing protein n=1 Tax=Candidatus Roizmanbacteria bacterium RIFCSPLOWO2_02_FULL_43_10 TaxID=1802078 RepID=A0A1F7JVU7_9BACT|nr:MAG: hypothetical protein A3I56_00625 [Candidatus Roizmanbacteria bacterium RIFCSPLOWO2_02_FULL_43_10]